MQIRLGIEGFGKDLQHSVHRTPDVSYSVNPFFSVGSPTCVVLNLVDLAPKIATLRARSAATCVCAQMEGLRLGQC